MLYTVYRATKTITSNFILVEHLSHSKEDLLTTGYLYKTEAELLLVSIQIAQATPWQIFFPRKSFLLEASQL